MEAINDIVGEMSGLAGGFAAAFDRARTRVERFNAMIQGANAALARMASLPAQLTDGRNRASFGFQFSVASANIQNRWSTGAMETARAFQDAWLGAGNAVARAMDAVIAGNERGTLILRQLWNATVESVIGQFSKMVVSWAMNHILMRAISFAFHAAINALGLTSLAQWLGIETAKTTATSVGATTRIGAHAAEAGAGAAAAESGIPVIGPVLALGAMAAMVVAVLALAHGFAAGGRPAIGRLALVGERGPELFVPDSAGAILPASTTAAILRGGQRQAHDIAAAGAAAARNNVSVFAYTDPAQMARHIERDDAHERYVVDVMRRYIHKLK